MSWVPCGNCHKTAGVQLRYVYATTFEEKQKVGWRARLCSDCFEALTGDLLGASERRDEGGDWTAPEERV